MLKELEELASKSAGVQNVIILGTIFNIYHYENKKYISRN